MRFFFVKEREGERESERAREKEGERLMIREMIEWSDG